MEIIDNKLIGELLAKAGASARLGRDLDLRTSGNVPNLAVVNDFCYACKSNRF